MRTGPFFYFFIFHFRFLQKYIFVFEININIPRPGHGRPAAGRQGFFCKNFRREFALKSLEDRSPGSGAAGSPGRPAAGRPAQAAQVRSRCTCAPGYNCSPSPCAQGRTSSARANVQISWACTGVPTRTRSVSTRTKCLTLLYVVRADIVDQLLLFDILTGRSTALRCTIIDAYFYYCLYYQYISFLLVA